MRPRPRTSGISDPIRGAVMFLAAAAAAWRGWQVHHGRYALFAYGLAILAVGMGIWHFARKPPQPRP